MRFYKMAACFFVSVLVLFSLVGCADPTHTLSSNSSNTNLSTQTSTAESNKSVVQPFEMEHIGESSSGYFDYYRDIATDVIYIRYADKIGYAGLGGLTVMLDPETGLPLTYSRYKELYIASSGNGDAFGVEQ